MNCLILYFAILNILFKKQKIIYKNLFNLKKKFNVFFNKLLKSKI